MTVYSRSLTGYQVEVLEATSPNWIRCEQSLLAAGEPVPLEHRSDWVRQIAGEDHRYLAVRSEASGEWLCGFPLRLSAPRSVPGHRMIRVTRFGAAFDIDALEAALRGLRDWARSEDAIVRLHVEIFSHRAPRRAHIEESADRLGLEPVRTSRRYTHTVGVDLKDKDEDGVLKSFHSSGRRFIREPGKKGFPVKRLQDARFADRMADLQRETFARTGGEPPDRNWRQRLRYAREHPDHYRIVGTFHPERPEPESLVAFVCGHHNGDHCVYADGSSTRKIDSNVSLTYAPVWELIRWALESDCDWFDMGGITLPDTRDDDPLAGISNFKRYFSEDMMEVGGEWRFHPPGWRGTLARIAARGREALQ